MSWGAKLAGFAAVTDTLEALKIQIGDDGVYVVGTNVEYAIEQEFGTANMDGKSYLGRAAREVQRSPPASVANAGSVDAATKAAALEIEARAKRYVRVDTGNLKGSIRAEKVK